MPGGVVPWVVSGRDAAALREQASALAARLTADPGPAPVDVGWSLAATRSAFECRAVVLGQHREELLAGLTALARGEPHHGVIVSDGAPAAAGKPAFALDCGDGPYPGMGAGLHARFPVFADAFDEVCAVFDAGLERSVRRAVLDGGPELPDRPRYARAALFALYTALARLLESAGVRPGRVTGRDTGEIAAAHLAGVLDLPDACALVTALAAADAGDTRDTGGEGVRETLGAVTFRKASVPVVDVRTGEPLGADVAAPEHWLERLQRPAQDRPIPAQALAEGGPWVRLGPGPGAEAPPVPAVLERGQPEVRALCRALALLHTGGTAVDWSAVFDGVPGRRTVALPTYAFQRRRYWLEERAPAVRSRH
ncbi:type I polyketide synthase [Streptomyces sp. SB3404]|uniref:Type I polyketide synthase n=1 Tax=Streptomyces boncukensis TaxID=2711219 RepID=A0A6G4X6B3_9ACTN|nr:type I polyketide synthase [Streptomyces boncukensis]